MSATTRAPASEAAADAGTPSPSQPRLPSASLPESIAVLLTGIVPAIIRGLFSPRRRAMKLLTAINADRRAIAVLSRLRKRREGDGVQLLGGRIVVLWAEDAIHEVLDKSATVYASDSGAKAKGMCHFQPDALTLSRGEEWRDRRTFNEAVLATGERVHPLGRRFVTVVAEECGRLKLSTTLTYRDWEQLFDRITLRVIFGDKAREDQRLTSLLEQLMGEANRLVGLKRTDTYYDLYARLEDYVREPAHGSLLSRFENAPHGDRTRIVQQIPHWVFAMRDTLAANAFRALTAIVADRAVEARVREEIDGRDLGDPETVNALRYLEGCLQEAMRLWPTTPLLAREVTGDTTLVGERLSEGTQVMLLNGFNHRQVPDGARMRPERWPEAERDYRFNHLSHGTQDCPGIPLVLLLGKAAIANVLAAYRLTLERPELKAEGDLPEMLDFFATEFRVQAR